MPSDSDVSAYSTASEPADRVRGRTPAPRRRRRRRGARAAAVPAEAIAALVQFRDEQGFDGDGPAARAARQLDQGRQRRLRPLLSELPQGSAYISSDADQSLLLRWPSGRLRGRDLDVAIARQSVRVQARGHRPAYFQQWSHNDFDIDVAESTWELADAVLTVTLTVCTNTGGAARISALLFTSNRLRFADE